MATWDVPQRHKVHGAHLHGNLLARAPALFWQDLDVGGDNVAETNDDDIAGH
jgi:hypothetical protein